MHALRRRFPEQLHIVKTGIAKTSRKCACPYLMVLLCPLIQQFSLLSSTSEVKTTPTEGASVAPGNALLSESVTMFMRDFYDAMKVVALPKMNLILKYVCNRIHQRRIATRRSNILSLCRYSEVKNYSPEH